MPKGMCNQLLAVSKILGREVNEPPPPPPPRLYVCGKIVCQFKG